MILTGKMAKVSMDVGGVKTPLAELREWSVSAETEKVDANVAGDGWARHLIGMASWEGDATVVDADPYWLDLMMDFVTVEFFDKADDEKPKYVGQASLDFERSTPYDDIIETSLTFTGSGPLTSPQATPLP